MIINFYLLRYDYELSSQHYFLSIQSKTLIKPFESSQKQSATKKQYVHFYELLFWKIKTSPLVCKIFMNKRFIEIKETNQELINYMQDVMTYFQQTFNQMSMKFVQFVTILHPIRNKNRLKQQEIDCRRTAERIKQIKRQTSYSGAQNFGKEQNSRISNQNRINNKIKKTKSNISNIPHIPQIPHEQQMYSFPLNQEQFLNQDELNNISTMQNQISQPKYHRNEDYNSIQRESFLLSQRQDIKRRNPEAKIQEIDRSINDKWSKMTFYQRKEEIQKLKQRRELQNAKNIIKKMNNQESKIITNDKFNNLLSRKGKKQSNNEFISIDEDKQHNQTLKIDIKDLRQAVSHPQKSALDNKWNFTNKNEPPHNFLSSYTLGDIDFE